VGHKIAVTGTEVDPMTTAKGTAGKPEPSAAPAPRAPEHQMRVNSVKMVSETCQ
jgi:hypothetical protein